MKLGWKDLSTFSQLQRIGKVNFVLNSRIKLTYTTLRLTLLEEGALKYHSIRDYSQHL